MQSNHLGLLVLDALSSPLVVLDQSGVIVYVNRAWKRFADTNSLAMENYGIGCNYLDYCADADSTSIFFTTPTDQGIRNVLSGVQEEYLCQYTCHSPVEERWFQMRVTPFDNQGSRHAVVLHENITFIKVSETRLWDIFEKAPIGMAVVSLDGRVIEANQSLGEFLGDDSHELLNLTCKQINHPDDLDNDTELLQGLLEGKQNSQQFSQILLSLSIDGFTFSNLQGHFLYTNSIFSQMLGYTQEEMLQMSVSDIEQLEDPVQIQTRINRIIADGFDRFETVHKHKDGKLIDVEVSSAYLSDQKQLFAFTRDITQRKQSEKLRIQQLELQRDTLVREVHHRIKNHLQGMHGLLSLYTAKTQNEKELIQDISAKISSIAVVYGMQSKTRPGTAYLCEIALEICKSVAIFGIEPPNIEWSINARSKALLHPEYAVPIALILNELITNAIKHNSKINHKKVFVELTFPDNAAVLIVSNHSQFQANFPDFDSGKGLGVGLSLVRAMLPKKGAHLTLKQRQGFVYAEITLTYPVITSLSS